MTRKCKVQADQHEDKGTAYLKEMEGKEMGVELKISFIQYNTSSFVQPSLQDEVRHRILYAVDTNVADVLLE